MTVLQTPIKMGMSLSQAAGEHSMYDDNGDGKGSEWGTAAFDPRNQKKDGYQGSRYSLDGWRQELTPPDHSTADRSDR
jgi:hypothetical protein